MNTPSTNRLYELLPRIIRIGDVENGDGSLLALLEVLDEQRRQIEDDIERMYDNLFIETCDEATVARLGALLGVRNGSSRAEVAMTLGHRRRCEAFVESDGEDDDPPSG